MSAPAIVLVRPQLAENIGKAARAMLNFGLDDLRLVAPRDGWPNPDAGPAAIGADRVIAAARVYDCLADAIDDLNHVYAATVRPRGMLKPVVTPEAFARDARRGFGAGGLRVGVLFGPERAGLDNDAVALADTVLTIPVNPACSSMNLAQAVNIVAYEWFKAGDDTPPRRFMGDYQGPAAKADLMALIEHLEAELDARNYYFPAARAATMRRNLRNILARMDLSLPEVMTLRGVVKTLSTRPRRAGNGKS
ncbi:MAG: RNA methyltransferase [Alphaproteobacteria bacterium]|nr:MAG: RNA methyltransferase [Alphaproteobacteria bacterium]